MNEDECQQVRGVLVEYADGELPAAEMQQVGAHLAECSDCRELLTALRRSLELTKAVWAESLPRQGPAVAVSDRRRVRRLKAVAVAAACVVLAAGAGLIWQGARPPQTPDGPRTPIYSAAEIGAMIQREEASARLAASARILSDQPGGKQAAHDSYVYLARMYPETSAGRESRGKIEDD